jgi:ribosomal protein L10
MNLKSGLHKEKLTATLLGELSDSLRSGMLSALRIRPMSRGRKWNVEYELSPHSLASKGNYQNRKAGADRMRSLIPSLTENQIKSMQMALDSTSSYRLVYSVTIAHLALSDLMEEGELDIQVASDKIAPPPLADLLQECEVIAVDYDFSEKDVTEHVTEGVTEDA